jgi:hypothetical protein
MSFRDCSQTIPRVSANSIGLPHSATEQATSSFQIGVESVSLALTRHGVVILKLRQDDASLLQGLQDAAVAHFAAQQHPLTPSVAGGHIVLPGCSSLSYRPGSTGGLALPHGVREAAHQVLFNLKSTRDRDHNTADSLDEDTQVLYVKTVAVGSDSNFER